MTPISKICEREVIPPQDSKLYMMPNAREQYVDIKAMLLKQLFFLIVMISII
jgi:hypothetical protein